MLSYKNELIIADLMGRSYIHRRNRDFAMLNIGGQLSVRNIDSAVAARPALGFKGDSAGGRRYRAVQLSLFT